MERISTVSTTTHAKENNLDRFEQLLDTIKYGLIDSEYRGKAGLHAFRHSLATVLITEEHVDPKTTQGILRHATPGSTMGIYTHAQDEAKRKALERFEAQLVR